VRPLILKRTGEPHLPMVGKELHFVYYRFGSIDWDTFVTQENHIIYEQPANEHTRACLKLERLFKQAKYFSDGASRHESRTALTSLIDILEVVDRPDLKSKFTQELSRHQINILRHVESPNVDRYKLDSILTELEVTIAKLHALPGKLGQELRSNEFLNNIRQHTLIAGGGCSFDTPAYHYWLSLPSEVRIEKFRNWFEMVSDIRAMVNLLLGIIRESNSPQEQIAESGFYQTALDTQQGPCQLIRIELPHDTIAYPEMSVGQHRFSVRFFTPNLESRHTQFDRDIRFQLTCCII